MSTPPGDATDLAGQIETLGQELSRVLEDAVIAPQVTGMVRLLIDMSGQLAARTSTG